MEQQSEVVKFLDELAVLLDKYKMKAEITEDKWKKHKIRFLNESGDEYSFGSAFDATEVKEASNNITIVSNKFKF